MSNEATIKLKLLLSNHITTPLKQAKEAIGSGVNDMKAKLSSLKESHVKAFSAMQDSVPGLGNVVKMLANPYALAAAAVVGLGMAYYTSIKMANEWEKGMAKVNVTTQLSKQELSKLSDQLMTIGQRNVAPIEQIPDAFNHIVSAGLNVNTAMQVLEPTLRAAKAGFTDVKTVADAAVGVMNSSGRDITVVYDVLFAAMNKGKAEFKDIANYLPKIIPAARGAGFALEETAGAWAYFTAQGQSAEAATTGMQNLIKSLSSSDIALGKLNSKTGQYTGGLPSLGIAVYDAAGKMRGIKEIAGDLTNAFAGLTDKQKSLKLEQAGFTDVEAKNAILSMTQDYKKLSEIIDFTKNSQGQLNAAYLNSMSPMDNWNQLINWAKGGMIKLGQAALPIINNIAVGIQDMIKWWKDLYDKSALFRDVLSTIGSILYSTWQASLIGIKMVWNMLQNIGSAINFVVSKIPGMGGGIEGFYNKVRPYLIYIRELLSSVADIMYKLVTFDFTGAVSAVKNFKMPDINVIKTNIAKEEKLRIMQETKDKQPKPAEEPPIPPAGGSDGAPNPTLNDTTDKVAGSAKQISNITVNIDAFNKGGINTQNTNLQNMDAGAIEDWFSQSMLRMIRGLEMSYSE